MPTDTPINPNMPFIHRDISWLSFNYRVLQEAKDPSVPLLERIKFLGIYSSNLDEYFRVRVASVRSLINLGKKTKREIIFDPKKTLEQIHDIVERQQLEFSEIYQRQIQPELAACGIHILRSRDLQPAHTEFLNKFFEESLIQHLQPILIVKGKIRTFLLNGALYLAVVMGTRGATARYAVVRIPSNHFPRFIQLPSSQPDRKELILLDDVVRLYLPELFPGYIVKSAYSIKMTRDADLRIEDEYSGDLIEKLKKGLAKRHIGPGTRFVYDRKMPLNALEFFTEAFGISASDLQPEGRYHNNVDWLRFPDFGLSHLKDQPLPPLEYPPFESKKPMFKVIAEKDRMLHYPYQKYDYVIRFLEQAARDPHVTEIKITQYRVAKDSQVVYALRNALQEGKKVTIFVEVKARFDEEANIYWAERLEEWGAKVLYSIPELKVHAKLALVTRTEEGQPVQYAYLSTGNFNEQTSRIYGDYGVFTADKRLTKDVDQVFFHLENRDIPPKPFRHILAGRTRMRRNLHALIDREIVNAKAGKPAAMTLKMNSLQDERMVEKLYEASNAGVKVRMILRGICCLVPQQKGFSENIEVISIVDRFLEHARVFVFHNEGNEEIFLSSADWMTRNLYHRIECAFPVYDEDLRQEIRDMLNLQFADNTKARILDAEQTNLYRRDHSGQAHRSQMETYEYYKNRLETNYYEKYKTDRTRGGA